MKFAVLCSLILSILHSILFYGQKWGISVFLFTIVGLFLFLKILEKNEKVKNKKAFLLAIPIIILSTTYFIFNNSFFNVFNMIVILILFLIMTIIAVLGEINISRIFENSFILFLGPIEEMENSAREISNCFTKEKNSKENNKKLLLKQIGKSILYSAPVLIVVIVLLASADETFGAIFRNIFSSVFNIINIKTIYSLLFRILIIIALTIYFIGIIIKIKNNKLITEEVTNKKKIKIENITLNTLLTLLNIVYLIFSITQGVHLVEQITNANITNYAQYARTGFFQLMVVSIINFVVIFVSKNNSKDEQNKAKKYIKIMNVLLAIFTIIILVTSVVRMNLYEKAYGYTFLRLMVYFIQITELILILPTILYIVKEKFDIIKWYIAITISMYTIVNFINIDYIIAKGNIDRYFNEKNIEEKEIDFNYLSNLSTDALPEIIRLLETKDELLEQRVKNYLSWEKEKLNEEKRTFPSLNISKERAKLILQEVNLSEEEGEEI